jgi:nicotinamidase-related amidase
MASTTKSPFHVPISLPHTALLLSDIQTQILARFPPEVQEQYLAQILTLLTFFRNEITQARSSTAKDKDAGPYDNVPLIIHHTFPFNLNSNAFISPYNKLASWLSSLQSAGFFASAPSDPHTPDFAIPALLAPPGGWGSKDEIVLSKIQTSCFGSSDLLAYLRARGIKHVVLVGLTTMGSILGSSRQGADLDFHVVVPKEGVMDDDNEVNEFLMKKVLPKFVDVVDMEDVLALGQGK